RRDRPSLLLMIAAAPGIREGQVDDLTNLRPRFFVPLSPSARCRILPTDMNATGHVGFLSSCGTGTVTVFVRPAVAGPRSGRKARAMSCANLAFTAWSAIVLACRNAAADRR